MCDDDYDEYDEYEDSYDDGNSYNEEESDDDYEDYDNYDDYDDDVKSSNEEESNQDPDDDFDNSRWHVGDPEDWADGPAGVPDISYMGYIKKNNPDDEDKD
ncbi:hypothetical protein [Methanobrevibacter sp.]